MSPAPLGFFTACLWFFFFVLGQLVIFWRWHDIDRSQILFRGILATAVATMITVALLPIADLALLLAEIYAVTTIGCLFILYGPFFYVIHTSLSVETLLVLKARGGVAPLDTLTERFASHSLLNGRLHKLTANGYLVCDGEHYHATPRALRVASLFAALKSFWRLGAGG